SKVPDTTTPDSKVPDTTTPDSKVPDTTTPDSKVPDTTTPDSKVPDKLVELPNTGVNKQIGITVLGVMMFVATIILGILFTAKNKPKK
ncbi:LPXTG cell wall anchor domain-containing protein, partial [Weissella cibaria]|uniref:LPXTG cell wall anchor domain-containing protein n=1 Tax=Weissella cibaria TaxID=137591 RepID=UPI00215A7343